MKYVLVLLDNSVLVPLCRDLWIREDVELYIVNHPLTKTKSLIRKIHTDYRWKRILDIPGQDCWEQEILKYVQDDVCYIVHTEALMFLSERLLLKIKNHPLLPKMVLFITDSIHANSAHIERVRSKMDMDIWDLKISYDARDCREFGYRFIGCNIYSFDKDCHASDNISDVYYIGRNKAGRNSYVKCLYDCLSKRGIKCNFHMFDRKYKSLQYIGKSKPGLKYHLLSQESYSNVLSDVLATNCILEVVQKGQKAQTARYYEAVCANKKLLTNNHYIKELPFYDERYMKIFNSFDDIDIEWLKRKDKIDYGYNDEFSPVKILDIVEENKSEK